jgi:glycosyltransferase involved in cell wall biosynthesis
MFAENLTIVVVNDFAHVNGGAGQVAIASASELARRGHTVILFSAVSPVDPVLAQSGVRVVCTQQGEIVVNPNRTLAAVQGIWNYRAARQMSELLRTLAPRNTVVHIHGWTKALSSSIVPVVLAHGAGVVVTIHDYFLACPNGGFFNYVSEEICHLRPLSAACVATNCDSRSYPQKLWRVTRQLAQISFGHLPSGISHFITISDLSRSIIEPFLPGCAQLHSISNPIDVDAKHPVDAGRNLMLIYVGRLVKEKGPLLLGEAAHRKGFNLTFVGEGYLRNQIEELYPQFPITGWIPREEVLNHFELSRALVFPSLWYENQPLVVLEAAARGIPAVVADTSAARDSVIDGETGLWFRGGDVDDLSRKLQKLENDEFVSRLGRAAYDRFWTSPPTLLSHGDQLEACYAQVLATRRDATEGRPRSMGQKSNALI